MNSPKFSIPIVTAAMIGFTILCNSRAEISSEFLMGFLFVLHLGLVWMAITILRHKSESDTTEATPIARSQKAYSLQKKHSRNTVFGPFLKIIKGKV